MVSNETVACKYRTQHVIYDNCRLANTLKQLHVKPPHYARALSHRINFAGSLCERDQHFSIISYVDEGTICRRGVRSNQALRPRSTFNFRVPATTDVQRSIFVTVRRKIISSMHETRIHTGNFYFEVHRLIKYSI